MEPSFAISSVGGSWRSWPTGLADHPGISVVSRDRGGGYGEAASKTLPHAVQVADRWHLMENASAAFLDAVRKSMALMRSAIGATTIRQAADEGEK
jgi:transposase